MKKLLAKFLCVVTLISTVFLTGGCENRSEIDFICFNTQVYISVTGGKITDGTENSLKSQFRNTEKVFSVNGGGDVNNFNDALNGERIAFTDDALEVFNLSKELYDFTGGLFNPAVLPLARLWKLSSDTYNPKTIIFTPPDDEDIISTRALADFNKAVKEDNCVYKTEDNIALDFGGIVKGYAVDKAAKILSGCGVNGGYISVGGSSIYVFSVSENLNIKHPRIQGRNIVSVSNGIINNSPLSTSGDYMRCYFDENGKRYSHVINGATGCPTDTGICSVTVIAGKNAPDNLKSAAATDAISTAIMLMEKDDAITFINQKLAGFYVIFAYEKDDEKLIISNTARLTVLDGDYTLNVI